MPIYEWLCDCGFRAQIWAKVGERDESKPEHKCSAKLRRLPGGTGLLYFEEGRPRSDIGLSDKPITSKGQHERMMRSAKVTESGNYLPKAISKNPQTEGMKRYLDKDAKGRWI